MFTIEQLKAAHDKVKSDADFPAYIQEILLLGVKKYETYVNDGRINYYGHEGYTISVSAKYETIGISDLVHVENFRAGLLAHQAGHTDYLTFIQMCAETGIDKWEISLKEMTCTYFDRLGQEVLVEKIPS